MLVVARKTDRTKCPAHAAGKVVGGQDEVEICFQPVACKGDKVLCEDGSIDEIIEGEETVLIGGKPVACKGHKTKHGGVITTGCPRVEIGRAQRCKCKSLAAKKRAGFIKYVAQKKKASFIAPPSD